MTVVNPGQLHLNTSLCVHVTIFQLKLTVVNPGEAPYSTESDTCHHCLCDNHWHTVKAVLLDNVITLKLDNGKLTAGAGSNGATAMDLNHDLYIGGFPGNLLYIDLRLNVAVYTGKFSA
jgi:hypothetical protein